MYLAIQRFAVYLSGTISPACPIRLSRTSCEAPINGLDMSAVASYTTPSASTPAPRTLYLSLEQLFHYNADLFMHH